MSLELRQINIEPYYYHREYKNDVNSVLGDTEWLSNGKRIATAVLPFISLYKPINMPLTVTMGVLRTWTNSYALYDNYHKKSSLEISYDSLQTLLAIASVAGTIFAHPLGMAIATIQDIYIETYSLIDNLKKGEKSKALENSLRILNSSLFFALLTTGSLELSIGFLAIQVASGLYQSLSDFKDGKYIEGSSHLLMASIRCNQLMRQVKLLQAKWKIDAGTQAQKNQNNPVEKKSGISPADLEKAQSLYASGLELMEQGKFQESINAFNAALALDPLESCIWERRATAYLELKNCYQAINDYTMAINLSPQNGFYYMERGLAYHGSGNKNAMINDMRIAAKLGEPNAQAVLRANNW